MQAHFSQTPLSPIPPNDDDDDDDDDAAAADDDDDDDDLDEVDHEEVD